MKNKQSCCGGSLFCESAQERERIIGGIRLFGQPLSEAAWLQVDSVIDIQVPDGFRGIVYPDSHSPYESAGVLRAIWAFASVWMPHLAFDIGDFMDLGGLSNFAPNAKDGHPHSFAGEAEAAKRQLRGKMRAGNPAKLIVMPGNHDDRERRQLSDGARMFSDAVNGRTRNMLTDIATNILGFESRDPIMFAWGVGQQGGRDGGVTVGDVRLRHGNFVNNKPGYGAYTHFLRQLANTFIGHVHRAGDFAYEDRAGNVKRGGELGMNVDPRTPGFNYIGSDQDWVHAFGVLTAHNGVTHLQVVPFMLGQDESGRLVEYFTWLSPKGEILSFCADD